MSESLRDLADGVKPPKSRRRQILALSGGGYRGLFTAQVLEEIEARFAIAIRDQFDLIAGTSAGALIAAGLAHGIPASTVRETFETHGPTIFRRGLFTGPTRFLRAPFRTESLSAALDGVFAGQPQVLDRPIAEQPIKLLVTAISVKQHQPRVFGGRGIGDGSFPGITLRDAILASAAAPTYFPVHDAAAAEPLVDGGLVANAPELVAVAYAHRRLAVPLHDLFVLSIGTASPNPSLVGAGRLRRGIAGWLLSTRGIVNLTLNAQESLGRQLTQILMGDRYVRVDAAPSPDEARHLRLDKAHRTATLTLKKLARDAVAAHFGEPAFKAFF